MDLWVEKLVNSTCKVVHTIQSTGPKTITRLISHFILAHCSVFHFNSPSGADTRQNIKPTGQNAAELVSMTVDKTKMFHSCSYLVLHRDQLLAAFDVQTADVFCVVVDVFCVRESVTSIVRTRMRGWQCRDFWHQAHAAFRSLSTESLDLVSFCRRRHGTTRLCSFLRLTHPSPDFALVVANVLRSRR